MKYLKEIIIFLLIVAVCYLALQLYKVNKEQKEIEERVTSTVDNGVPLEAKIVAKKVDKDGLQRTIAEMSQPILRTIELKVEDKRKIDSLQNLLNIKSNQLQSYTQVKTKMKADTLIATRVVEKPVKGETKVVYRYKDRYLSATYDPNIDTAGAFSFAYDADLNITQYMKRKWLLGAKRQYLDIYSNDPRVTISGVQKMTIKQDQPSFGLRVQANSNWNPQTNSIGVGPGVKFDAGKVSVQGNYTYYPMSGRWRPMVNVNFDLIRF